MTTPPNPHPADHESMVFQQNLSVAFDYPVVFQRNILDPTNALLADVLDRRGEGRQHRVVACIDAGTAEAHPDLLDHLRDYAQGRSDRMKLAGEPEILPGGEVVKNNWNAIQQWVTTLGNRHLDRQSFVLAIGGGSFLDMVGFAVSVIHRGLRLVRMPTTTLAQCDAGVGVKNGMNAFGQKNFVGTFAPPFAVLNDATFLSTLSQRDWIGGVAEAFKVAIIRDAAFVQQLCDLARKLRERDLDAMESVVHRCAILHLEHIRDSGDPFEFGSARPLDFGHWAGHKLELLSEYRLGHGQAAAVGIALDCHYAMQQGLLAEADLHTVLQAIDRCGLPTWAEELQLRDEAGRLRILAGIEEFREHLGGRLNITLPDGLGQKCEIHEVDQSAVSQAVDYLRLRSQQGSRP